MKFRNSHDDGDGDDGKKSQFFTLYQEIIISHFMAQGMCRTLQHLLQDL